MIKDMNVDEEILRENAMSERLYVLKIAREKIAALDYGNHLPNLEKTLGQNAALAIIDELINDPNV